MFPFVTEVYSYFKKVVFIPTHAECKMQITNPFSHLFSFSIHLYHLSSVTLISTNNYFLLLVFMKFPVIPAYLTMFLDENNMLLNIRKHEPFLQFFQ
jgi:hypothetical protein